jgi:GNAT superfamily N-acetyltransferase
VSLQIQGLQSHHDRKDFDCGEAPLNDFLQRFARQQGDKDFSRTYVATEAEQSRILGFYAISSASIDFANWPADLRLPRYPIPIVRIGRLAVDNRSQGQGLGLTLLQHAMTLAVTTAEKIGLYAVVVDAKHEAAAAFYMQYGFVRFPDQRLSLFLTIDVIRRALIAR